MLAPMMEMPDPPEPIRRLAAKYGWSERAHAEATGKLEAISAELDSRLTGQRDAGSDYFVGAGVSAADFYWANFAALVKPLPPVDNPMPDYLRHTYEAVDERTRACLTPALEAHRDMMYERHISLPLDFLPEE
jgi:glutathione S-transferase